MRIMDWSSDVCSSDLVRVIAPPTLMPEAIEQMSATAFTDFDEGLEGADVVMMLRLQHERMDGAFIPSPREYHMLYGLTPERLARARSEEHTSELQSLMRISYAVFCLKKKIKTK